VWTGPYNARAQLLFRSLRFLFSDVHRSHRRRGLLKLPYSLLTLFLFQYVVPPTITRRPSEKHVTFGGNVTFTCRAEGVPEPRITWYNTLGIAADTDPRATVLSSGDLFIHSIEIKDAGRYECVAENSLGRDAAQVTLILTGLSK